MGWLVRSGIDVGTLLMRGENDWRSDAEIRNDMLGTIVSASGDVSFALEETEKACDFYRAAGIHTLQLTNPHGGT